MVKYLTVWTALCLAGCGAANNAAFIDFENPDYGIGDAYDLAAQSQDWDVINTPTRMDANHAIISNDHAASGKRSLKIIYPAGEQSVKQAAWSIPGQSHYTLEYKVRFADDFDFNGSAGAKSGLNGGKLPGLAALPEEGTLVCTGGKSCDVGRGFSARLMWRTDGVGVLYLYDLTKSRTGQTWGEDIEFAGKAKFTPGQWNHIREDVSLNTPGQADGSVKVYLDGQLVVDLQDREIIGGKEKIDIVLFSTFFGGNSPEWFPAVEQTAYFDDFGVRP